MRYRIALLIACLALLPTSARADEKPKKPAPSKAARAMIERQGFAVDAAVPTTLTQVYRFPKGPVFVTQDAGLGAYLVLLRRVAMHLGGGWDAQARAWIDAWRRTPMPPEVPAGAGFVVRLLERLYAVAATGERAGAKAVEAEIARLRAGDDETPFPLLDTPLRRSPCRLWVGDYLSGPARWQLVVYLLTRIRFPEDEAGARARRSLQSTMPPELRAAIEQYVGWAGSARVVFPGTRSVLDLEVLHDQRLPPGTLGEAPELPTFLLGAAVGNAEARRRLKASPLAPTVLPDSKRAVPGSLRAGLDALLRLLPEKPKKAPALFRSPAWEALELQTIAGSRVLFDKAIGVATAPWDVFSASDHPGFVYPHPAFWRALAELAEKTADDATKRGIRDYAVPTLAEIDRLERALEAGLAAEKPFSAGDRHLLVRCVPSFWSIGSFLEFGGKRYLESSEDARAKQRARIRKRLDEGLLDRAREAAKARGLPSAVGRLRRLAAQARSMAEVADAQLQGQAVQDLAKRLLALGSFLQSMLSGSLDEDPFSVCVARLVDADRRVLFQGCEGLDSLWIRLPWQDGHILCRGAVFSFRELISRTWISDDAWRERARGKEPPQRPSWSTAFVAGAGGR